MRIFVTIAILLSLVVTALPAAIRIRFSSDSEREYRNRRYQGRSPRYRGWRQRYYPHPYQGGRYQLLETAYIVDLRRSGQGVKIVLNNGWAFRVPAQHYHLRYGDRVSIYVKGYGPGWRVTLRDGKFRFYFGDKDDGHHRTYKLVINHREYDGYRVRGW